MENTLKYILKSIKANEANISMILGALVVIVVGLLMYNYFKDSRQVAQISETSVSTTAAEVKPDQTQTSNVETHKVVKGEHLWGIAEKYYGSGFKYVELIKANNLKPDGKIEIDQVIVLPKIESESVLEEKGESIPSTYMVEKSDSLWSIAVKLYGDGFQWQRIFDANKELIKNASIIEIGWTLKIPQ